MKSSRLTNIIRTQLVPGALALSLFTLPIFGCSTMTTEDVNGSMTTTTFGNDILTSFENVFETCNDPFLIESGMDEVSLAGDCEISDGDTLQEQLLLAGLISQGTMELGEEIPEIIETSTETIGGLPWPVQNCVVHVTSEIRFESLEMTDLQAWWKQSSGTQLRIDLDFGKDKIGEVEMLVEVDCPSSLSSSIVKAFTGKLRNELNGVHGVYTYNRDLDLTFDLDHDDDNIYADLNVKFEADNLYIDIDWSKVETLKVLWWTIDVTDGSEVEETARADFESIVDSLLQDSLSSLEGTVADMIESGLPNGETICSMKVAGGDLDITTSSKTGALPCLQMKKAPLVFGL